LGLHDVAFLGLEIDDDLAGQQAPLRYSPEAPALVQTAKLVYDLGPRRPGVTPLLNISSSSLPMFVFG
jgi:hypothetical protein